MKAGKPETVVKSEVWTIPNILSLVRLLMIPMIAYAYLRLENGALTVALLILSGATDVVDGWIARRFHMVSDLGKALDPVADKLTQFVTLICLATRHAVLRLPIILMVIKEVVSGLTSLMVIKRRNLVLAAQWHGKLTTCLLYALMIAHVIWQDMPAATSNVLTAVCLVMMVLSFFLYARRNIRAIREETK